MTNFPIGFSPTHTALLSSFLRTYQASACDGELLSLNCDQRTVINIVVAQYGETAPPGECSASPPPSSLPLMLSGRNSNQQYGKQNQLQPKRDKCPADDVKELRYAFLRKMEMNCREQNRCRLWLNRSELSLPNNIDTCNDITKFAEVAFKCRPSKQSSCLMMLLQFN